METTYNFSSKENQIQPKKGKLNLRQADEGNNKNSGKKQVNMKQKNKLEER